MYSNPAYVDVNEITRNDDISIYDLVDTDGGYTRVETNCRTRQFRAVRKGFFESSTQVNYMNQVAHWQEPTSSYHKALLTFMCNL